MTGAAITTIHVAVWWRNGGYCGYMQVATLAEAERVAARLHDYRFGDGTIFGGDEIRIVETTRTPAGKTRRIVLWRPTPNV
jgi:hypothetical protein